MDKYSQLEQAKEQGYIIGPSAVIDSLQTQFYDWCKVKEKPYIKISTRAKYCHLSVDTPSPQLRLNENGVSALKDLMKQYIDTNGTYSVGEESMFHDKVPIHVAGELANGIIGVFQTKDNLETNI
jgi:hypothetical protein